MKGVDMFNFQDVMGDYYQYDPKDDAGKASKRSFQANMVQSAFDTQLAMAQAEQAQKYDLDTRLATANLELSNQKALMEDTFSYGTQKMAMEYDLQSRFAVDDAARELNQTASEAGLKQDQTRLEGTENRLTLDQQGRQEMDSIAAAGVEQRKGIATQGDVDVNKIGATGEQERESIKTQGSVDIDKIGAQGDVDISKIGAAGEQERATLQQKTREQAKDRTNQFQFANQLASR
jgi:uncharacterized glyoxalase superfamily protein PhnB